MLVLNLDSSTVLLFGHITVGPFLWRDTKLPQLTHTEFFRNNPVYCLCRIYSTVAVAEELADGGKCVYDKIEREEANTNESIAA
jgi:hypothetical protein